MAARELAYTVVVHDDDGAPHVFERGASDVPAWAKKKISNPSAWAAGDDADDLDEDEEVKPYAKWLKADLEAELAKRNEGRDEGNLIEVAGKGTVKDLAAALDADDEAQADADDA